MKIGLHIADFTFPNGPSGLADDLSRIAAAAEQERIRGFAELGVAHVHTVVPQVSEIEPLRVWGREIIPAVADL